MRVLLATDFSPHAEDGLRIIRGLALPPGSIVRVVHVIEPFPEISMFAPAAITAMTEAASQHLGEELERTAARLRAPGREVVTTLVVGRTADVIVEQAEQTKADLIVVGSRGRRAIASALLGSVSAEVVDRAPCPVLVARGPALRRLILADDGSETASAGARLITTMPALSGLEVRVVSVVDAPFPTMVGAGGDDGMGTYAAVRAYYDSLPALRDATSRAANDRVEGLQREGVKATAEVREGDAAAQLIDAAIVDRADCVIIGSHGRTGLARMFLGSVARAVLFNAPCSVLIVRGGATTGGRSEEAVATAV